MYTVLVWAHVCLMMVAFGASPLGRLALRYFLWRRPGPESAQAILRGFTGIFLFGGISVTAGVCVGIVLAWGAGLSQTWVASSIALIAIAGIGGVAIEDRWVRRLRRAEGAAFATILHERVPLLANATLIHHYPSKVALIKAVVESFTKRFEAVAQAANTDGGPRKRLARHMRSSVELMRTSPEMFVVLNEIMVKARRDDEIRKLVQVPLTAWRDHIVSLLSLPGNETNKSVRSTAEEIAAACMAQLLGMGLLLTSSESAGFHGNLVRDRVASRAIDALTNLVREAKNAPLVTPASAQQ